MLYKEWIGEAECKQEEWLGNLAIVWVRDDGGEICLFTYYINLTHADTHEDVKVDKSWMRRKRNQIKQIAAWS